MPVTTFDELLREIRGQDFNFVESVRRRIDAYNNDYNARMERLGTIIKHFHKTGKFDENAASISNHDEEKNQDKENKNENINDGGVTNSMTPKKGRKTRAQKKSTIGEITSNAIKIKQEKMSILSSVPENDPVDEMPAPSQLPPKRRIKNEPVTRSTRSKRATTKNIKQERLDEESDCETSSQKGSTSKRPTRTRNGKKQIKQEPNDSEAESEKERPSDVIVQDVEPSVIELSDSEASFIEPKKTKYSEIAEAKNNETEHVKEPEFKMPTIKTEPEMRTTRTRKKVKNVDELESKRATHVIAKKATEVAEELSHSTRSTRSKMRNAKTEQGRNTELEHSQRKRSNSNSDKDNKKSEQYESDSTVSSKSKVVKVEAKPKRLTRAESKEKIQQDKSKRKQSQELNETTSTVYEDASSEVPINSTYVSSVQPDSDHNSTYAVPSQTRSTFVRQPSDLATKKSPEAQMNGTVVIEKSKFPEKVTNGLMTDDESEEEARKTPPKTKVVKNKNEVFSPYEVSPVKKKVEAFEKLGAKKEEVVMKTKHEVSPIQNVVNEKVKMFTPQTSRILPKQNSTSKISKYIGITKTSTSKTSSLVKSSQEEFREREMRRREKEQAAKKREAQVQAQMEEKRKIREEKQLKAQQQRILQEKERQKALEAQKLKEEKHKKILQEREEKLQRAREELEKKRLLAKQKAIEEKNREEHKKKIEEMNKKLEETKKTKEQEEYERRKRKREEQMREEQLRHENRPIYLTTRAPPLPTDDCYDSDDPESEKHRPVPPPWFLEKAKMEHIQISAGDKVKNTFFCCQPRSCDLIEIFKVIDPKKLKRTSSAVWKKPPRYTLMPNSHTIFED